MSAEQLSIRMLDSGATGFSARLESALSRDSLVTTEVAGTVASIISDVRDRGDAALVEYSNRFDRRSATSMLDLTVSREQLQAALQSTGEADAQALRHAATRIRSYHEKQKQTSWRYEEADGSVYGQKVTPLASAGVYVPGGKANYPSSMLMLAIPAQVAGVGEIIATVPTDYRLGDPAHNLVFAAAALAGVDRVFTIGGAQAVAALAYGTESVPRVDKITGPGNIYVTEAKRQVFGDVGIDMLAGPSELTVICDGRTDPDWIAMDLFSQAEHDEQAQSILISPDPGFIVAVQDSIRRLLPDMERRDIIRASLQDRGIIIQTRDLQEAAEISNRIAPEHLELSVADPDSLLEHIENAGAIFLGSHTAEALGDYCAGPSHVLPTSGTARFFSALGVYDFQKRSSVINCSPAGAARIAGTAATLARRESLQAHALSAEYRMNRND
ncbi:MAG: histidinol dehydrogenase [Gammaproteobacteria bacterium]|nr:histidinol dehydrogenase [Pseudomonadales bacterium]